MNILRKTHKTIMNFLIEYLSFINSYPEKLIKQDPFSNNSLKKNVVRKQKRKANKELRTLKKCRESHTTK